MEPAVASVRAIESFIVRNQFESCSFKSSVEGLARSLSKTPRDDVRLGLKMFLRCLDLSAVVACLSRNLFGWPTLAGVFRGTSHC